MKVNDYVRTKDGRIYKIGDIGNFIYSKDDVIIQGIIKSSSNIIDLIEVLDLVYVDISPDDCGGIIVPRIAETEKELNSLKLLIENKDYILKSIITHEQIESIEYKVKE